jgi:hypothetical protein
MRNSFFGGNDKRDNQSNFSR